MHFAGGREAGEAAIGAGDDVLAPDDLGKPPDALGDRLGMLDEVRAVRDDAGDQQLAVRQLRLLPRPPLVLVLVADCGFACFSTTCEVHPTVVWSKLASLAKGARLATEELWGRA